MIDLKWIKNNFINAQATVSMLGIFEENVYKLVDSSKAELNKVMKRLAKKVQEHQKKKENILIYSYVAGHGVADSQ